METLDLHGQTWSEALPAFIEAYNGALRRSGGGLEVVHGYGASGVGGVLRKRLRAFLRRHEGRLEFMLGEDVDGNAGVTLVVPRAALPEVDDLLAEQVLEYCERPKAQGKIMGKFRRHGAPAVQGAIRALERAGRLRAVSRRGVRVYEAVDGDW